MKLSSTSSAASSSLYSSSSSTSVEGMGFAIPSNEVVKIINQLVKYGKISRPALGASVLDLSYIDSESQQSILKLPSSVTSGVVLMKVNSNSTAKNAGLKQYDVVVKVGSHKVSSIATLKEALYSYKIGQKVQIQYYRNGKLKFANATLK